VRVEAGTLKLDQQRKIARFRDKVVIHRGELTVRGPLMDARYDDQGQLTTLEMRGGVEMVDGDRRAVGQRADYDAATRLLVLTGDPKLFDRGDVLRGNRITLQLDTHEVKVERATGRLRPEQHKDEHGVAGGGKR
jgi:lipopolysaccharide export system protein LptA